MKLLKKHIGWFMDRVVQDRLDSSAAHAAYFLIISFLPFVAAHPFQLRPHPDRNRPGIPARRCGGIRAGAYALCHHSGGHPARGPYRGGVVFLSGHGGGYQGAG